MIIKKQYNEDEYVIMTVDNTFIVNGNKVLEGRIIECNAFTENPVFGEEFSVFDDENIKVLEA